MKKKTKMRILEISALVIICSLSNSLIIALFWVVAHEAVHVLFAKKFGLKLQGININLTGAEAKIQDIDSITDNEKLIIYLSGPLFNLIAAIILFIILRYYYSEILLKCLYINLGLALFNMLPAYPLDGTRIYEVILSKRISNRSAEKILENISYGVSIILMILFCVTLYIHRANVSLLIAGILIIYSTLIESKNVVYTLMGNIYKKRGRLENNYYLDNKSISVYYKCNLVKIMSLVDKNKFNSFFIVDDDLNFLGVLHEDELIQGIKEHGNMRIDEYLKLRENLSEAKS